MYQYINKIFATKKNNKELIVLMASFLYIIANAFLISQEKYYLMLIPFALIIATLAIISLDKIVFLIVFFTPLSIPLSELSKGMSFNMSLPSEPLLFGVLVIFILKLAINHKFDRRILSHPITLVIFINLIWLIITGITSSMPIVSFKFVAARIWFLVTFYFLATQIFRKEKNIPLYIWLYIIPLLFVIGYTLIHHSTYGLLNHKAANFAVNPFYNDHTSYGAVLAMLIPVLIHFLFIENISPKKKFATWIVFIIIIVAIIFSYTRASWVSLAGAFVVWLIIKMKIKFKYLAYLAIIIIVTSFSFRDEISFYLQQNNQDSSQDLTKHIKSISNVSSDASNLERLNRWYSAFRMFNERPVFGWGPGTYMFKYARFQRSEDQTIISTNAGDGGNAHSEYIGPLAEAGVFGSVTFIIIIIFTCYKAITLYTRLSDRRTKSLVLSIFLGLVTYYLHGFFNNFLDTDKASALFWGFTAIIVAIDIYHSQNKFPNVLSEKQFLIDNELQIKKL